MILGNQVEWAIHCICLLGRYPDFQIPTKVLAEFHDVPKEYLSKALQSLATAGLIKGSLGPKGGYQLAKDAKEITLLDIVEALEGRQSTFLCTEVRKKGPCRGPANSYSPRCDIAEAMDDADDAWRESLRRVKISEMNRSIAKKISAESEKKMAWWISERASAV